jgi:transposase
VDARRASKRIPHAHPADQCAQLRVDLRSPSLGARLPTPVAAKAGPVPTHERLRPDDRENLQDRRKPAIQLDQEPAIMVREPDATRQPTPQDNQLMSKHRVLGFKPQLRLEWRGQDGQNETEQPDHSTSLGDSITASTQIRFSVHTTAIKLLLDNHSAHISRETQAWLAAQPAGRFEFTFTPKHGSWLNLIEGFFSKFARSVLRHIRVASKQELKERIMAGIEDVNRYPVIHTWSYKLAEAA